MPTPKQKKIQTNKGVKLRPRGSVTPTKPDALLAAINQDSALTITQINFLSHMLQLDNLPNTIRELCASAGIDHSTYYMWMRQLQFTDAFNRVCDVIDVIDRPWIDAANRKAARDGNIAAQRTYYLRRGLLGSTNQVNTQVNIDFSSLDSKVG